MMGGGGELVCRLILPKRCEGMHSSFVHLAFFSPWMGLVAQGWEYQRTMSEEVRKQAVSKVKCVKQGTLMMPRCSLWLYKQIRTTQSNWRNGMP